MCDAGTGAIVDVASSVFTGFRGRNDPRSQQNVLPQDYTRSIVQANEVWARHVEWHKMAVFFNDRLMLCLELGEPNLSQCCAWVLKHHICSEPRGLVLVFVKFALSRGTFPLQVLTAFRPWQEVGKSASARGPGILKQQKAATL